MGFRLRRPEKQVKSDVLGGILCALGGFLYALGGSGSILRALGGSCTRGVKICVYFPAGRGNYQGALF